ncbi:MULTISPECIES: hypothetical protein [Kitasatospora]|uniref:hypothetical protein n=1 Tax=Kitasatospora TaxID=2063 RepID=UPI000C70295A|nr:hypothetical protein [Kitasatospora sp. GP30]MDH6143890.1 hypothetical protein [Kitasatospora sp. GP30]
MSHHPLRTAAAPAPVQEAAAVEWDLVRDAVRWSPAAYQLLARDPALGPLTLDELPGQLLPEDRPVLRRMVTEALVHGRPVAGVLRVADSPSARAVACTGRADRGTDGQVVALRMVLNAL